MAVVIANTTNGNAAQSSGTLNISVTRASGEGLLLGIVYGYSFGAPDTISSVVWDAAGDNQALVHVDTQQMGVENRSLSVYALAAPTSAKTGNITITFSGSSNDISAYFVRHITGHDTSAMISASAKHYEPTPTANEFPITVTSATGELVVAFCSARYEPEWVAVGDFSANGLEQVSSQSSLTLLSGSKPGAASVSGYFECLASVDNYDNAVIAVSISPSGGASATITLTDPVAVVTGSTATCTITRNTAASGTITYNLTSSATGVATVPATATISDGQTTGSFNITGVSAGSSTITATNASDSGETDTATANVSALKGLSVTFGQANLSGLTFAWFDEASPDLFDAPTVVGTTESTDGSGVMSINLTGTSVAVGNTGYLLIYKAGATAPDDIAFFGRMTVADIG